MIWWTINNKVREFWNKKDGISTIEMILILLVLVALVVIFRDGLVKLLDSVLTTISEKVDSLS